MHLHSQRHHNDGYQCLGTVLEHRPYEPVSHIDAKEFNGKYGNQHIDNRHMEDDIQRIPGSQFSLSGLIKAQRVKEYVHLNQQHGCRADCGDKIRGCPIKHIRGIGKHKGDQRDTDIACVGKHGGVFKSFRLTGSKMPQLPIKGTAQSQKEHFHTADNKYRNHGHVNLCGINAVEDKAGENNEECKLIQCLYIQVEFLIQHIAYSDKNKQWQYVIGNNL